MSLAFSCGVPPLRVSSGARETPKSSGATMNRRTLPLKTSAICVSPESEISSRLPAPCTTNARDVPSSASAAATVSITSAEKTPSTCASAPAGLVSGPRRLKTVRFTICSRAGMAWRAAACAAGANRKPMPISRTERPATASGRSMFTPRASRASAEPLRELTERLPCLATRAPAAAATIAEAVDMLNVPVSSPPVPHVSTSPVGRGSSRAKTGAACCRITRANPDNSSTLTARWLRAISMRTISGVATRPESISSMNASASARESPRPASAFSINNCGALIMRFEWESQCCSFSNPRVVPEPRKLSRRQKDWRSIRDDKRVLIVSRKTAVGRLHAPPVACILRARGAHCDNGFDGHHQTGSKTSVGNAIIVVRQRWSFVNRASDAVAAEFANHAKTAGTNFLLDGAPDFINAVIGPCKLDCLLKRAFGASREPPGILRDRLNRDSYRGIRHIAVFFEGHIELYQITRSNFPRFRGDAVNGFVVQADQHIPRKAVNEGGSGARPVLPHDFTADVGEFPRADALANAVRHGRNSESNDSPNFFEGEQFRVVLYGHAKVLVQRRLQRSTN